MHYSISLSQQSRSESWRAVCPLMLSTLITGCVQMVWIIAPRSLPVQLQDRSRSRLIFVIKFAVAYHLWVDAEACPDGFCTSRWSCDGDITNSSMWHTDLTLCHAVFSTWPCSHPKQTDYLSQSHRPAEIYEFFQSVQPRDRTLNKLMCFLPTSAGLVFWVTTR